MAMSTAWYVRCDFCGHPAPVSCEGAVDARNLAADNGFRRDKHEQSGAVRDTGAACRENRAAGEIT
jgi:hypothetical protein